MKHENPIQRRGVGLAILSLLTATASFGQTTAPARDLDEEAIQLDVFTVDVTRDRGYGSSNLSSATRLAVPMENVPQSVSVLNDVLLDDIVAWDFNHAVRYVPNVTQRQNVSDGAVIRGFSMFNRFRNGFFSPSYESDMANVQRIELIKGPAASIAGSSQTGGMINVVTKKPLFREERSASLTVGSYSFLRGQFDMTGPVPGHEDTLAYRIIASGVAQDGPRRFQETRKNAIFPSLQWNISDRTTLLIETEYIDAIWPSDNGPVYIADRFNNTTDPIPVPEGVTPIFPPSQLPMWAPWDYTTNEPGMRQNNEVYTVFATLTHRFNEIFTARQAVSFVDFATDFHRTHPTHNYFYNEEGDLMVPRSQSHTFDEFQVLRLQGDLAARFSFNNGITNTTLIGYEYGTNEFNRRQFRGDAEPLSLISPSYSMASLGEMNLTFFQDDWWYELGYFANNQLSAFDDRLILTAGIRRDTVPRKPKTVNNFTGAVTRRDKGEDVDSPMYGINVKPLPWLSLYAVYSEAGAVATTVSRFPNIADDDPRQELMTREPIFTNDEYGAKMTFFDGSLSVTIARFKQQQHDGVRGNFDPSVPGETENILEPSNISEGWELEFAGSIGRLSLYGGYANLDTRAPGFKPDGVSPREFRGVPDHKFSFFGTYDLSGRESRNGFSLQGGVVYQTSVYGRAENTYRIPGATILDAGIAYRRNNWRYLLTVKNITDKELVQAAIAQSANTVNPPRAVYLTGTYEW